MYLYAVLLLFFYQRLWEDGWRERYYLQKFGVSSDDESYDSFRDKVVSIPEFLLLKRVITILELL